MAVTHGLAGTYRSARSKCRCDECKVAHRERHRREGEARAARLALDPSLAPHGSRQTYKNWGCRCAPCTKANSDDCRDYKKRRLARKSPSVVTVEVPGVSR